MPAYDASSYAFVAASAILIFSYAAIVSERINRAVVALLGAGLAVALGVVNQDQAYSGIDWNTIFLLAGMMMLVAITRRSGVFQYLAVKAAHSARGSPARILLMLSLITALLSAFLDNVTTVLLTLPVTLAICGELRVAPFPFLFTQVLASNIGGTATLIGDPPNILIGSAIGLSFNDFVVALGPLVVIVLGAQLLLNHLIWGRKMQAAPEDKARLLAMNASAAIVDRPLLYLSLTVLSAVIFAFIFAGQFGLKPGTIAMLGAAVLLLIDNLGKLVAAQNEGVAGVFREVEWTTLFFFVGLFIIVTGAEKAGLLRFLGDRLFAATDGDLRLLTFSVLWSSALLSAVIDNIPFVATMIPLIKSLAPQIGGDTALLPVWWALAAGACFGGNGTLIGASANLIAAGFAEKNGIPFRFSTFFVYGFPMMLVSVLISHIYIALFLLP